MAMANSSNSALRNFSAACWQWKHAPSGSTGLPAMSFRAACRSASALRIHSAVTLFIKDLSQRHDRLHELIVQLEALADKVGSANQKIEGEGMIHGRANPHRLRVYVLRRHDDEHVNIAVDVRFAIGVRAEKDNLVRLKAFGDLPRHFGDGG